MLMHLNIARIANASYHLHCHHDQYCCPSTSSFFSYVHQRIKWVLSWSSLFVMIPNDQNPDATTATNTSYWASPAFLTSSSTCGTGRRPTFHHHHHSQQHNYQKASSIMMIRTSMIIISNCGNCRQKPFSQVFQGELANDGGDDNV